MTIIDNIKAESLTLRKARRSAEAASLTTLLGEIETLAKAGKGEMTDAVVVTVVKKFIKNIDDSIRVNLERGGAEVVAGLQAERKLYEQFLPKQLSAEEVESLIDSMIASGMSSVGDCMKALKTDHAGTYDGSVASAILKRKFGK